MKSKLNRMDRGRPRMGKMMLATALLGTLGLCALPAGAGPAFDWFTANNGNTSFGGIGLAGDAKFTLNSAIGQPATGNSGGDTMILQAGFMPAFVKVTLPPLRVTQLGITYSIIWPDSCPGVVLEYSSSATGAPWTSLGGGVLNNGQREVALVAPSGNYFFRLRKDCPR